MNEQVKKIIKSSLCPKEKWVKDKQASQCFNCGKQFNAFFRRKHHCRYCGQIFCLECSNNFFRGEELGEPQKQIRMCLTCYNICWKYIMKHNQTYFNDKKSSEDIPDQIQRSSSYESVTNDAKLNEINSIVADYDQNQINLIRKLQVRSGKKFMSLMQSNLKDNQIPLKYLPNIFDITVLINSLLPANAMITQQMNLTKYLKIACFYQANTSLNFKLKHGFLIKNNHISKRGKSQFYNVYCILVYGNFQSKDILGMQATFENIVSFRQRQLTKLISYCKRLKISVIFIEGNVERQIEQALGENNISVISRVETEQLESLKKVMEIQNIVRHISKLSKYLKEQILGFSAQMSTVTEKQVCYKNQQQILVPRKYLLVCPKKTQNGLTLGIYGQNYDLIRSVQKQITYFLRLYRHLKLKVHRIHLDQAILDSMTQQIRKQCYMRHQEMFFSLVSQVQADINNYVKVNYLSLVKVRYYQTFPMEVGRQSYDQYVKHRKYSFFHKWSEMTSMCGKIQNKHVLYYQEQDIPIGKYILKKISESRKVCQQCHKPNYSHIQVFYSAESYVKCWVQTRLLNEQSNAIEKKTENNQFSLTLILQGSPKKENQKSSKICSYIQCLDCQQILSKKISMTKEHLQFSFYIWVFYMFRGAYETFLDFQKKQSKNHKQICSHHFKVRVFEYSNKMVKFFIGKYTPTRTYDISHKMLDSKYRRNMNNYLHKISILYYQKSQILFTFILNKLKKIADFFDKNLFQTCVKNPKESSLKLKKSLLISSNVSKVQLVELMLPDLINEISILSDVCEDMFEDNKMKSILQIKKAFLSIVCICKIYYRFYLQAQRGIKAKDSTKKYKIQNIENFQNFSQQLLADHNQNAASQTSDKKMSFVQTSTQVKEVQFNQNASKKGEVVSQFNFDIEHYPRTNTQPQSQSIELNKKRKRKQSCANILVQQNKAKNFQKDIKNMFKQKFYFPISLNYQYQTKHQQFQFPGIESSCINILISALLSKQYKRILDQGSLFKWIAIFMEEADHSFCMKNQHFRKVITVLQTHMNFLQQKQESKKQSQQANKIQVDILYPVQFSKLRQKNNLPHEKFIDCLQRISQLNNSKEGRYAVQTIYFDFENEIIIQRISGKQYLFIKRMLLQYFLHVENGTMLNLILGVFMIKKSQNSIEYFIVFEKLGYGMGQVHTYDLSFVRKNKFSKNPYKPMDLNFLIDRNSEPIMTVKNVIKNLHSTVDFLWRLNIVDYSIFLVVAVPKSSKKQIKKQKDGLRYLNGGQIKVKIVNYLQQYVKSQGLEALFKFGQIEPEQYKNRVLNSITNYFCQIPL